MMKQITISYTLMNIDKIVAETLLPLAQPGSILLFYGQLGAGKTTLIKALVKHLGIHDNVSSPTFSYVNVYHNERTGLVINHFDLYRLSDTSAFIDQGFDEWLTHKNTLSIIEWPEVIEPLLISKNPINTKVTTIHLAHDFTQPDIRFLTIMPVIKPIEA